MEILSFECAVGCYIGISSCACLRLHAGSRREEGENVSSIKCYKSESGHWRDKEKYCKIYSPRKLVVHGERAHTQASARFAIGSEDRKNSRNIYILLLSLFLLSSSLRCYRRYSCSGDPLRKRVFSSSSLLGCGLRLGVEFPINLESSADYRLWEIPVASLIENQTRLQLHAKMT